MKNKDGKILNFPNQETLIDGVPASQLVKQMLDRGLASFHGPQAARHRTPKQREKRRQELRERVSECMRQKRAASKGLFVDCLIGHLLMAKKVREQQGGQSDGTE